MSRYARRLAFPIALALLAIGGAGFARASVASLDDVVRGALVPSEAPALLGPINELGRNGWQCAPERAAKTPLARDAELPAADISEGSR